MTVPVDPTPKEVRPFQGRRAGLVTRSAAAGIDAAVVVVGLLIIYLGFIAVAFVIKPRAFEVPTLSPWVGFAVAWLVMALYLALGWRGGGRTYGCQVMGLRVVDRRGREIGLMRAVLRAILYLLFPLGLGWVIVSHQNLSIQDAVLHTSVIYDWDMRPVVPAAGR